MITRHCAICRGAFRGEGNAGVTDCKIVEYRSLPPNFLLALLYQQYSRRQTKRCRCRHAPVRKPVTGPILLPVGQISYRTMTATSARHTFSPTFRTTSNRFTMPWRSTTPFRRTARRCYESCFPRWRTGAEGAGAGGVSSRLRSAHLQHPGHGSRNQSF